MKNFYTIIVFAIFVLFIFINISTLNDGHNWGDDFAQYIQHAINLLEHKPYASGISYGLRILCPPGFPFLLSPVIYCFGVNFKILKSLNIFLWALSALATYGLALRWLDLFWARMITVWFLTSPIFFFFKQNVLSDIPFMCFVLLSIWSFTKFEEDQQKNLNDSSRLFLLLSIFFMSYSFLIRWVGMSLFLAVILYFFIVKRDWKRPWGFIFGAILSWSIAFQCGSLTMGYADKTTTSLFQKYFLISWYNLGNRFQTFLSLFISDDKFFSQWLTPSTCVVINNLVGLLVLGITGSFFYRLYQRKISFMGSFTFIYLIGTVLWPVNAGTRYLLPIMVPITIYLIKCIKPAWRKWGMLIFLFLILQNIFVIVSNFKFNDDDIYKEDTMEMMQWVKLHIKPEDNYMFSKPRALGLLTHRIGYNFGDYPQDNMYWYRRIKPLHINYLIVDKGFDRFTRYNNFCLQVDDYYLYIYLVWKNNFYKIFNVVFPPIADQCQKILNNQ